MKLVPYSSAGVTSLKPVTSATSMRYNSTKLLWFLAENHPILLWIINTCEHTVCFHDREFPDISYFAALSDKIKKFKICKWVRILVNLFAVMNIPNALY